LTPLLEGQNLSKTYPVRGGVLQTRRGTVAALAGVSFHVPAGGALGIVGESGSGKSTLARILAGFLSPTDGRVLWEGRPAEGFSRKEWAGRVQMVFQDPAASLNPRLTVGTQLGEALAVSGGGRTVAEALTEVGLPADARFHYPHAFSGGQKQRIAIARALAPRPRLLVADEPVSALDLSVQAQILNLLADLRDQRKLALILISHDWTVVRHMTDRVLVLERGRAVESGPTEEVLARPQSETTRALLAGVPEALR
jgi:ABC-type glutathione transport system ATPase component